MSHMVMVMGPSPLGSHSNCLEIDTHYKQQNAAAAAEAAASAAATSAFGGAKHTSRYKGTHMTYALGKCGPLGTILQLEQQRDCNADLVRRAVEQLRGRALIFLGDSLMLQQWLSALLMMASFLKELRCPSLKGIYSRGYNGVPPFQCAQTTDWKQNKAGLRLCYTHRHPFHKNIARALELQQKQWSVNDTLVMNSGMWHADNLEQTNKTVTDVLRYSAKRQEKIPTLLWRETSPAHFIVPYSAHECLDPPTCSFRNTTAPVGSVLPQCVPCSEADWRGCITAMRHNEVAKALLANSDAVKVVSIWNHSVKDWDAHLGLINNRQNVTQLDCSHYCLPSPTVESWTLEVFAELTGVPARYSCDASMQPDRIEQETGPERVRYMTLA